MKVRGKPHIQRCMGGWIVWRNVHGDWWTWGGTFRRSLRDAYIEARRVVTDRMASGNTGHIA